MGLFLDGLDEMTLSTGNPPVTMKYSYASVTFKIIQPSKVVHQSQFNCGGKRVNHLWTFEGFATFCRKYATMYWKKLTKHLIHQCYLFFVLSKLHTDKHVSHPYIKHFGLKVHQTFRLKVDSIKDIALCPKTL